MALPPAVAQTELVVVFYSRQTDQTPRAWPPHPQGPVTTCNHGPNRFSGYVAFKELLRSVTLHPAQQGNTTTVRSHFSACTKSLLVRASFSPYGLPPHF